MSILSGLLVMMAFAGIYACVAAMIEARGPQLAAALSGRRDQPGTVPAARSRAFSLA